MTESDRPVVSEAEPAWSERNQQWLAREVAALCARIEALAAGKTNRVDDQPPGSAPPDASADEPFTPALVRCAEIFGLSTFERELLLLAAAVELDSGARHAVAQAQAALTESGRSSQPTFSLALRVLADPHWDALSPLAPLRRWRLIELEGRRSPVQQPLHIDERVLHYITGVAATDERLTGIARLQAADEFGTASPTGQRIARELSGGDGRPLLLVLTPSGCDHETLRHAAADGIAAGGVPGLWLQPRDLPSDPRELAETALLVDREAALAGAVIAMELETAAESAAESERRALAFIAGAVGPVMLLGAPDTMPLTRLAQRRVAKIGVAPVSQGELALQLRQHLPAAGVVALQQAVQQFHLSPPALRNVIEQVTPEDPSDASAPTESAASLSRRIWQACRESSRGGLDLLAQRVDSRASFDDIVLPLAQMEMLRDIAEHLRHRHTVYETWGMAGKTVRGRGVCALFAGESGTGKTLAAEAIANEVGLDLYRIDLATVVSKYIGETEKNLKRVFDGAETSGAVLLFDEAEALFGKRSEVKDSHDRYANIEVAYLLQRIEAYRGLAILTTNMRSAIDRAFLRRIRFVVQFPFPDDAARREIWRRELPDSAPQRDIDHAALARIPLSGGHIHSVALGAAFIAAAAGEPIMMPHLRLAAQREAAKFERPLLETSPRSVA